MIYVLLVNDVPDQLSSCSTEVRAYAYLFIGFSKKIEDILVWVVNEYLWELYLYLFKCFFLFLLNL